MATYIFHSNYRSSIPSGENRTVEDVSDLIAEFDSVVNVRTNSDLLVESLINRVFTIVRVFNPFAASQIKATYKQGDLVQIHQAFPVLTLSDMIFIKKRMIPTLRIIHNYRMSCLSGNHFRNNLTCHKCTPRNFTSGIYLGCYNNNRFYSFVISMYTKLLNSFLNRIECNFIAISKEVEKYLRSLGIKDEKLQTISNFTSPLKSIEESASEVVFIGRMEQEKGVLNLIDVWKANPQLPKLHLIGSGHLDKVISDSIQSSENIVFYGICSATRVEEIALKCKVAIFLNLWSEPFGRVLIEAMSRGQYIITTAPNILSDKLQPEINGDIITPNPEVILKTVTSALAVNSRLHINANIEIWKDNYSKEIAKGKWKQTYLAMKSELGSREGLR